MQIKNQSSTFLHYLVYGISYFIYGVLLTNLGPLIPYLAEQYHRPVTDFSFLFTCRASGMIIGAILSNIVQSMPNCPSSNRILTISSLGIFVMNLLFSISDSDLYLGLCMFICGIFYFFLELTVSVSIVTISDEQTMESRLQLINGIFGAGGIIGPVFLHFLEKNAFLFLGVLTGIMSVCYYFLKEPETIKASKKSKQENTDHQKVPNSICILLCFSIFLYLGLVMTEGGWISSYAVLAEIGSKDSASIFSSLVFTMITAGRLFIWQLIRLKSSLKLMYSLEGIIVFQILSLIVNAIGYHTFSLYMNSITIGLFLSPIYAIIFSISSEFNHVLSKKQMSWIAASGVFGQAAVMPFTGLLMKLNINMFFYSILMMAIAIWIAQHFIVKYFGLRLKQESDTLELIIK